MVDDLNLFDICCVSDVTFRPKDRSDNGILFQVSQEEITDISLCRPPYLGAILPDRGDSCASIIPFLRSF